MSASPSLRIGVIAAGLSCLLLGYAAAEQETSGQTRSDRSSAAGQSDRSSTQQSDRATTQRIDRTYATPQRRTANYRGENAVGGQNQAVERYLAGCLLAHNQSEVQLSEFAQQKAENSDVKQFAQELVKDHRQLIEKLQPLAGMYGGANHGVSGSFGARTESERTTTPGTSTNPTASPAIGSASEATSNVATTERSGAGNSAIHQLMQIDRQITERATKAARDELQQKSGAEFDKAFVGCTIGSHVQALAALEVIGQQGQGKLAQVAQQAQPTVQQHLERAKQLMKQLEGQASASGGQAQRQSTRTER